MASSRSLHLSESPSFTPSSRLMSDDPFTPSQRISLSMADLSLSHISAAPHGSSSGVAGLSTTDPTLPTHPGDVSVSGASASSIEYKRELAKLLAKSRGTPYEYMLRRFVENKLKEMQVDSEEQKERLKLINSPEKLTLASLSESKYDSPAKSERVLPLSFSASNKEMQNQSRKISNSELLSPNRIEMMAQPLERNKYKGQEITRVSTNHLGRQRPPPRQLSLSRSPSRESTKERSRHTSPAPALLLSRSVDKFNYSQAAALSEYTQNAVIPQEEFQEWLANNREWDERKREKVAQQKTQITHSFSQKAQPRIFTKSVRLAELAQERELKRISEILHPKEAGNPTTEEDALSTSKSVSHVEHHRSISREKAPRGRSISLTRSSATVASDTQSLPGTKNERERSLSLTRSATDVYQRLALRGKAYAEERKHSRSSTPAHAHSNAFTPAILERSVQMAETRRSRERSLQRTGSAGSLSHTRERSHSRSQSRQNSMQPETDAQSLGSRQRERERKPSIQSRDTAMSREREHDLSREREGVPLQRKKVLNLQELVHQDLEKIRSKSRAREQELRKKELSREFIYDESTIRPFQPTIVANETHRIMEKKKTSFEERNLRFIEAKMARKVISSRTQSPGPGHYHGTSIEIWRQTASSPPRTAPTADKALSSPGYRGYSFGKGKLVKHSDIDPDTTIYEFKDPPGAVLQQTNSSVASNQTSSRKSTPSKLQQQQNRR